MNEKIYVTKINEVYLRVTSEAGVEAELSEYFSYFVDGYKYMPKYKAGIFDGKLRLYNLGRKTLYVGLYTNLQTFAERNNYELIEVSNDEHQYINKFNDLDEKEVHDWVVALDHTSKGQNVDTYEHQLSAIYTALNENRVTLESPTSSGKSLIIYSIIRWHVENNHRILLIVPTTQLCEQIYSDFDDYSSESDWNVEDHCQRLYSGKDKKISKSVLISTWQSLLPMVKADKECLQFFDCVVCDEVHLASGASIGSIMESLVDTKYRIGLTGTLSESKANKLQICGLFGRQEKVITTRELMDQGKVVELDIRCLVIKHCEEDCKLVKKADYASELDFIVTRQKRNEFIANLALATKGNTLLLVTWIDKHLIPLAEIIKAKANGRKIYVMYGDVPAAEREAMRLSMEHEEDVIVIASSAVASTGVNMPSIENIILGAAGKSKIRNLQSIGRGLRLKKGKSKCRLFDIADDLSVGKYQNHLLKHFKERLDIYSREQFEFKIIPVKL